MKNLIIWIFVSILVIALLQPLIESFNVFTEKITISAAMLNSARAARNNAVLYDELSELNSRIDYEDFMKEFARAFGHTLDIGIIGVIGDTIEFAGNDRWGPISITMTFEYYEIVSANPEFGAHLEGRYMSRVTMKLEMPYIFKTGLLRTLFTEDPSDFIVTDTRMFLIQVVN